MYSWRAHLLRQTTDRRRTSTATHQMSHCSQPSASNGRQSWPSLQSDQAEWCSRPLCQSPSPQPCTQKNERFIINGVWIIALRVILLKCDTGLLYSLLIEFWKYGIKSRTALFLPERWIVLKKTTVFEQRWEFPTLLTSTRHSELSRPWEAHSSESLEIYDLQCYVWVRLIDRLWILTENVDHHIYCARPLSLLFIIFRD